jgi:hypothetical protein
MKTVTSKIILTALVLFTAFFAKAEFVKTIHKSWPINKVKALSVDNKLTLFFHFEKGK